MWPYWLMFLIPAWAVLVPRALPAEQARWAWFVVGSLFVAMIGFRHEIGGDWPNYLAEFWFTSTLTLPEAAALRDPGHAVVNWLVARTGTGIYLVNVIYAVPLMAGTVVFCRRQPNPWLALLAAVPYMLIVVGMGYSRQSVALGFALLGLAALGDGRVRTFVLWVTCGALFHQTAVLLLPIAALAASRNRLLTGALVIAATGLIYYLLLADSAERLWQVYVEQDMQSQGGEIRVAMNALPTLLLLVFRRQLLPDPRERKLWLWMSVLALICIPLIGMASTAVDRVALYLLPMQLFVFGRLPRVAATTATRTVLVLGIIGYYAAVQYIWLNYATHAEFWVPYQFMPLG